MNLPLDITGLRSGRLVALSRHEKDKSGQWKWLCQCDCGNTTSVLVSAITRTKILSCGCYHREVQTKHGLAGSRIYCIYRSIRGRCDNKNDSSYALYGGRGIIYSDEWDTFEGFLEEMADGYSDDLSIERINPNGNYCKENCKWIPLQDQAYSKTKFCTNKSGVSGVHYDKWGDRWKARWHEYPSGKGKQKSFPVAKYGEDAFKLACDWRIKMIAEQVLLGAPYTEFHGVEKEGVCL